MNYYESSLSSTIIQFICIAPTVISLDRHYAKMKGVAAMADFDTRGKESKNGIQVQFFSRIT